MQGALREVMEAIYEQDFLSCSHGFRPGRRAHDALRAVDAMVEREGIKVILEADFQAYFDSLDRTKLREMLQIRIADGSLLRLVGKCLHVGVLDGKELSMPDEGTVQGSSLSPLLGYIYLHYVLDLWFEKEVKPGLTGHARLIRYADDFVMGFARQEDADRVMELLHQRVSEYGLTLHPDKTRLLPFKRPDEGQKGGKGPATFDFLGFTLFWVRGQRGRWRLAMKTCEARFQRAIKAIGDWCRRNRHGPLKDQHAALSRRLNGHFGYFGVNGNQASLNRLRGCAERIWRKWLCRRSQRSRYTWERFKDLLKVFPLPKPKVRVRIWGSRS